ncbi:MAG TPA: glycosyltransferase family 4 protein [Mycobacteriales bacterium]|nr:glycosyltransferase family 4 protein [Mycobacteriales bacterium]
MARIVLALGPSTGGIGRHVRQLHDELVLRGWQVTVAGPAALADTWLAGVADFAPVELPGSWPTARSAYAGLAAVARGADVLHAHGLRAGLVATQAARRAGVPSVVSLHNLVLPETAGRGWRAARLAEPLLGRLGDAAIGVSPDITRRLGRGAVTIPLSSTPVSAGRDRAAVRAELGIEPTDVLALCVARLHRQKRLDVLIDAARRARARAPALRVLVAGSGPAEPEIGALAAASEGAVCLLGRRNDVGDLLGAADIAVLSSAWEATPLALHEAARFALPLVGTATGGIGELVVDEVTGLLVPVGDAGALAAALVRLAEDPGARQRLGAAARDRELTEFAPERMMSALERVYAGVRGG